MRSETARRQKKLHYVRALWNQSEMQIDGTHELCGLPLFWLGRERAQADLSV